METTPDTKDRQITEILGALRKDLQEQVMSELQRASAAVFQPLSAPPSFNQLTAIDEELRQNLIQASHHYKTASWIPDHRFALGRPLLKKVLLRLLSFYTDRQTQFNTTVVRLCSGLHNKLALVFQRADRLEQENRELHALIETLSDRHDQELRELRALVERLSEKKTREY